MGNGQPAGCAARFVKCGGSASSRHRPVHDWLPGANESTDVRNFSMPETFRWRRLREEGSWQENWASASQSDGLSHREPVCNRPQGAPRLERAVSYKEGIWKDVEENVPCVRASCERCATW